MMTSDWMDTSSAAKYANGLISEKTLRKKARKKLIEHGRNGREYLFKPEHIDRFFLKQGSGVKR